MFSNILKILFSYKIFTFSQPFSQQPNKFYYRKFQNIHLTTKNQNKNINQEEERVRSEGDRVTAKSQIQTQPNRNPQNKSQPNTHHLQPPTTTHNHRNLYPPPKQHHTPPKLQFHPRQQTPAIKSHNRSQASKSHDPWQVNSNERKP